MRMDAVRGAGLGITALLAFAPALGWAQECVVNAGETEMSAEEAKAIMVEAGYTDIRKVEKEYGCLEGKGFTDDQKRLEVYVHPVSGEIVEVKIED